MKLSPRPKEILDLEEYSRLKSAIENLSELRQPKPNSLKEKSIFIDCGGYDGCSSVKFILANPCFDCITFEPNPSLWSYYDVVPTTLIRAGVSIFDGTASFLLDPVDADGSTLLEEKQVVFGGAVNNSECEKISIPVINLSSFIHKVSENYEHIVLKMDIEGAEYDILEEMIERNTIEHVDRIYCEFHYQKCGISYGRHAALIEKLKNICDVCDWDALDFAVHQRGARRLSWRENLVRQELEDLSHRKSVSL